MHLNRADLTRTQSGQIQGEVRIVRCGELYADHKSAISLIASCVFLRGGVVISKVTASFKF